MVITAGGHSPPSSVLRAAYQRVPDPGSIWQSGTEYLRGSARLRRPEARCPKPQAPPQPSHWLSWADGRREQLQLHIRPATLPRSCEMMLKNGVLGPQA